MEAVIGESEEFEISNIRKLVTKNLKGFIRKGVGIIARKKKNHGS